MFRGRNQELKALNGFYTKGTFQFVIIYGRRRIGKSSLIREFVKDKPNIFYTALNNNKEINLTNFSREILKFEGKAPGAVFPSFQAALENLFELSLTEQFVLVIDEYPYLAETIPELSSLLQMLIDRYQERSKMFLILCGSSISYIEEKVLAYKAPLFGRRTGQMKLKPLSFKEVIEFYPELDNETQALIYGIYGGTPFYLNQYDSNMNFRENVISSFLESNTLLFDEPESLIKQEVRETANYNSVLTLVALGNTRINEIATKAGIQTNKASYYLKNLIEMDLVEKEFPFSDNKKKSALYKISDHMFRFWYRFVETNSNWIYQGLGEIAYSEIMSFLSDYMGPIFEEICQEYLWKLLKKNKSPVIFHSLSRWWGTNKETKQQEEIDIIGKQNKQIALFAECKWTNKKVDNYVLDKLIERSQLFDYPVKHYYLFSKTGFTEECVKRSEEIPNVYLITFDEMMEEFKS